MAEIQVRTMMRFPKRGESEVVMSLTWVPRGSSNRGRVRAVAKYFRRPELKGIVKKIVVGTTRLTVHVRPCMDFFEVLEKLQREQREKELDAVQFKLFAQPGLAE